MNEIQNCLGGKLAFSYYKRYLKTILPGFLLKLHKEHYRKNEQWEDNSCVHLSAFFHIIIPEGESRFLPNTLSQWNSTITPLQHRAGGTPVSIYFPGNMAGHENIKHVVKLYKTKMAGCMDIFTAEVPSEIAVIYRLCKSEDELIHQLNKFAYHLAKQFIYEKDEFRENRYITVRVVRLGESNISLSEMILKHASFMHKISGDTFPDFVC